MSCAPAVIDIELIWRNVAAVSKSLENIGQCVTETVAAQFGVKKGPPSVQSVLSAEPEQGSFVLHHYVATNTPIATAATRYTKTAYAICCRFRLRDRLQVARAAIA